MALKTLKTKIFLDSGDPEETREAFSFLGFLDGQTTNPTLISKSPEVRKMLEKGEKLTEKEALNFYRKTVQEISTIIPQGSISIEVYADKDTVMEQMLAQAREMYSWIPNGRIKFPTTTQGIKAAQRAIKDRMRANLTLCFSQEQAAAILVALKEAEKDQVYISPFIGRLDDRGENGMELIKNILQMRKRIKTNIEVLTSSVRKLDHLLYGIYLGSDIVTAPLKVLREWKEKNLILPDENFKYQAENLTPILYQESDLNLPWERFNLYHYLTEFGLEKFSQDWKLMVTE